MEKNQMTIPTKRTKRSLSLINFKAALGTQLTLGS